MKLTTGILAVVMMTGAAWAQNPDAIDNTRSIAKSLQQKQTNDTNAALDAAAGVPAQSAKPAPGAAAPAVKPATIPGTKPVPAKPTQAAAPSKAAAKPVPVSASSQNNALEHVNVIRKGDAVEIEIKSREAVTPKVSKLSSPARLLVELPATAVATAQNKIPVGSAGVKGVRIGMDGKTPPTTSVVVDLEQACGYELTQGPGNSSILTLHTQAETVAKSAPAPAPAKIVPAKASAESTPTKASAPAPTLQKAVAKPGAASAAAKPQDAFVPKTAVSAPQMATAKAAPVATAKPGAQPAVPAKVAANEKSGAPGGAAVAGKPGTPAASKIAANDTAAEAIKPMEAPKPPKPEEKKWAMSGSRDPFFSPVVQQPTGSGCSTGKKCLEIGQINLRGVVKSETGFIAVVTNSLNKAYFLHENDPVFNGYVVKITGDSVVFSETVPDKLGKPLTREVVKKITTPAV
jgi:Tfp pilus assembly protein PilP